MSFQHLRAQYDREGYVIVRQLLEPAELAELERNLERYVRQIVPNLPETDAFYDDRNRPETLEGPYTTCLTDILKCAVSIVQKEQATMATTNKQVLVPVIVYIDKQRDPVYPSVVVCILKGTILEVSKQR